MKRGLLVLIWCGALLAAGPKMVTIDTPAGASSGEADLISAGGGLVMTWIESRGENAGSVKFARYNGNAWTEPVTIVDGDNLFINWADTPRVFQLGKHVVVTWLENLGDESPYAYGVRLRSSGDHGKTWRETRWLHDDRQPVTHGFVSLAAAGNLQIAAIWLDGRAMSESGAVQLRKRIITPNSLTPEVLIDGDVCSCCGTDLIFRNGKWMAAYRNKTDDHVRDIYTSEIGRKTVREGKPVHNDNWKIQACPVNGPALARAGQSVVASWFTAAKDKGEVKAALSRDGYSFGEPYVLSSDASGRADVTFIGGGNVVVSWVEPGDESGKVRLQRLRVNNKMPLAKAKPLTAQAKALTAEAKPAAKPEAGKQDKPEGKQDAAKPAAKDSPDLAPVGEAVTVSATPAGRVSGFPRTAFFRGKLYIVYQSPTKDGIELKAVDW